LEGYANLEHWVAELDKKVELILLKRLTHIIQVWCAEFDRTEDADNRRDHTRELSSKRRMDKRAKDEKVCGSRVLCLGAVGSLLGVQFLEGHMTVKPIVHEIRIQNQVIFLDPPIEYARQTWVRQLHDWIGEAGEYRVVSKYLPGPLGVVCRLRRIQSSRYEIGLQMQSAAVSETTYTSLVWEQLYDSSVLSRVDTSSTADTVHG
jgi:hypothetical protein